jgi:hypothetical protein
MVKTKKVLGENLETALDVIGLILFSNFFVNPNFKLNIIFQSIYFSTNFILQGIK